MKFHLSIFLILYFFVGCGELSSTMQTNIKKTNNTDVVIGGYFDVSSVKDDVLCISYPENINEVIIISKADGLFYFEKLNIVRSDHLLEYCNTSNNKFYDYALKPIKKYSVGGYVFDGKLLELNNIKGNEISFIKNNDEFIGNITTCTSSEGEHLNIWHKASMDKRLLYAYRYLNADLMANCQDKEVYEGD